MDGRDEAERFAPTTSAVLAAIRTLLSEEGLDPEPPFALGVLDHVGIRVRHSRYLLPNQMLILGEFDKPSNWSDLTDERKIVEALKRGAVMFVYDNRE